MFKLGQIFEPVELLRCGSCHVRFGSCLELLLPRAVYPKFGFTSSPAGVTTSLTVQEKPFPQHLSAKSQSTASARSGQRAVSNRRPVSFQSPARQEVQPPLHLDVEPRGIDVWLTTTPFRSGLAYSLDERQGIFLPAEEPRCFCQDDFSLLPKPF